MIGRSGVRRDLRDDPVAEAVRTDVEDFDPTLPNRRGVWVRELR